MRGNHLRYAENIIRAYDGAIPLATWLKAFFRENKQMGSRDRKTVSELVYGFYRLGHSSFPDIESRLLAAFNKTAESSGIFPWKNLLSNGIDEYAFEKSFLSQPDLFIRIRPGNEDMVKEKLGAGGIAVKYCGDHCIGLPNSTYADQILALNAEAVIQDRSSQYTGHFLMKHLPVQSPLEKVWDCCAASGGKSIMVYDLLKGKIQLTVSDIRESILHNLSDRFAQADIGNYRAFVADLTQPGSISEFPDADLIIADVPCSGSGTWARTPEQLFFFKEQKIAYYADMQRRILSNVGSALRAGKHLLYMTCSVFAQENEDIVNFLLRQAKFSLVAQELIRGYHDKADTMFAALLRCS